LELSQSQKQNSQQNIPDKIFRQENSPGPPQPQPLKNCCLPSLKKFVLSCDKLGSQPGNFFSLEPTSTDRWCAIDIQNQIRNNPDPNLYPHPRPIRVPADVRISGHRKPERDNGDFPARVQPDPI
jgi:hypothetical protein